LYSPLTFVPLIALPWRTQAMGMLVLSLMSNVAAVTYARAEEWLAIQAHGENPAERVVITRWWPSEHHAIAYSPGYGWTGWD
jgi:hypothetical protein